MEKSKIQLAKEKCENLLKFFTEKQTESCKFQIVKVKDSDVVLEFPELVKGADVTTSSPSGSVPATDGDYTLSDGTEITVNGSKIDKIVAKPDDAPAEDAKPADEKLADAPVEDAKPAEDAKPVENTDLSDLTDRVSKLEDAIKSILEAISGSPSAEDVQDFNSKIEALAKLPTQMSADNRVEIKESELDKYKRIANSFKK